MVLEYCPYCELNFERIPKKSRTMRYFNKGSIRCPKCKRVVKKNDK